MPGSDMYKNFLLILKLEFLICLHNKAYQCKNITDKSKIFKFKQINNCLSQIIHWTNESANTKIETQPKSVMVQELYNFTLAIRLKHFFNAH